jgi:hypothetical protein
LLDTDEPVPPIPEIRDIRVLNELYQSKREVQKRNSKGKRMRLDITAHCKQLESIGDREYNLLLGRFLVGRLGYENHPFSKLIHDKGKSNEFMGLIGDQYEMRNMIDDRPRDLQQNAQVFEAFLGALYIDRGRWGGDFNEEVGGWLQQIWEILLRPIFQYTVHNFIFCADCKAINMKVSVEKIEYPTSPIFEENRELLLLKDPNPRELGFLATAKWENYCAKAFHPQQSEAEKRARQILRHQVEHPRKINVSAFKAVETIEVHLLSFRLSNCAFKDIKPSHEIPALFSIKYYEE